MSKAKEEKEKGNAAFKTGDYATAVGHYSAAIIADRSDVTLPLNRAAAYLKLGKNEDAERDCTTVLSLPGGKNNVKALFRRAQARIELSSLDNAEADLREGLRIEPQNDALKKELEKLTSVPRTSSSQTKASVPPKKPYRRRVPITIVEDTPSPSISQPVQPSTASSSIQLTPVSTRKTKKEQETVAPQSASTSKPLPLPDSSTTPKPRGPWEVVEVNGHRVGGGIIRKTGGSSKKEEAVELNPKGGKLDATSSSRIPTADEPEVDGPPFDIAREDAGSATPTLFDFTRSFHNATSTREQWALIQTVSPSALPKLLQTSLEPPTLLSILGAFQVILRNCTDQAKERIIQYMTAFPAVPRFGFVVMFLSETEKGLVRDVWMNLGATPGQGAAAGWIL